MFLANGFLFGSWAPQIPMLLPRHDITEVTLGLLIFGLGVGAVVAMSFSGAVIARIGSRRALRLFALLSVGTLLLVVLSPNLVLLAIAMAVMGAFLGCMDVAMNANAVEAEKRLERAIMSSSHGFWSLGGFIGGGLGGIAIARLGAEADIPRPELARLAGGEGTAAPGAVAPRERRSVHYPAPYGRMEVPVFARDALPAGHELEGPAVIEEYSSTTVLMPGDRARVGALGEIVIRCRP
jgi:MFS family permease